MNWGMAAIVALCGCGRFGFDSGDGFTPVVVFNANESLSGCPGDWVINEEAPESVCTRWTFDGQPLAQSIYTAVFPVPESGYREVRGVVRGYQYGSTDGFAPSRASEEIDDVYVDGISITYGQPRVHLWTYVSALSKDDIGGGGNCPCRGGTEPPPWVGSHYYCGSSNTGMWEYGYWYDEPLWESDYSDGRCGTPGGSAWFERVLDEPTSEPIEVRIMANQNTHDEDIGVAHLELFVR